MATWQKIKVAIAFAIAFANHFAIAKPMANTENANAIEYVYTVFTCTNTNTFRYLLT